VREARRVGRWMSRRRGRGARSFWSVNAESSGGSPQVGRSLPVSKALSSLSDAGGWSRPSTGRSDRNPVRGLGRARETRDKSGASGGVSITIWYRPA
jgi:hypothetical protein